MARCSSSDGYRYDLHTHTRFSCDSQTSMDAMCHQGLALGLRQIAFTEHVDLVPADVGYGFFQPAPFLKEVSDCRERLGSRLTVLAGVEIGEYHRFRPQVEALLAPLDLDLVIGSLHWVGDELVSQESYFQRRSMDRAYQDYFVELEQMCWAGGFDVLGHLDLVERYGGRFHGGYEASRYRAFIRPVLEAMIHNGIALEINGSGTRNPVGKVGPAPVVLKWYGEMGGELLTFGSDAHAIADLAAGWEAAVQLAEAAGFTNWTTFSKRTPSSVPLRAR